MRKWWRPTLSGNRWDLNVLCLSHLLYFFKHQPCARFSHWLQRVAAKFTVGHDHCFTCRHIKLYRFTMKQVRLASSPLALRILSPLFMSPQVGPWEQAERGPVSIRNTGRHNGLCLQLHCWQTPTQRSWKGSPSVLTHIEEWVSVLPLRAVFVQYIQLLSKATVLPSMGAEVLMKTRRKGLLRGCQREFMFIRWALRLLDGTCMYAEKPRVTEQQVIGLLDG